MLNKVFILAFVIGCHFATAQMRIDSTFGANGTFKLSLQDFNEPVGIAKLQNDSLLLLANLTPQDTIVRTSIALIKLTPEGYIDISFGVNGVSNFQFPGMEVSEANSFIVDDSGTIWVLGTGYTFGNPIYKPVCLAKLNSDGIVDSTFGTNGAITLQFDAIEEFPRILKPSFGNKLLIGGFSTDSTHTHVDVPAIARLNRDGTPDTTFGEQGKTYLRFPNGYITPSRHLLGGVLYDILQLTDSSILVSGGYSDVNNLIAYISRLDKYGNIDTTFFNTGYMAFDFTTYANNQVVKMKQASSGLIWFGATSNSVQGRDFYEGTLDLAAQDFNEANVDFNGNEDVLADILLDADDNPVFVGNTILPVHNFTWYGSDYFAIERVPGSTFPFNTTKFTFSDDTTVQTGAVNAVIQSNNRLVCYGFQNKPNGYSQLILVRIDISSPVSNIQSHSAQSNISVYPNPTHSRLFVDNAGNEEMKVLLRDLSGKLLDSATQLSGAKTGFDVSKYSPGIYLLTIEKNSATQTMKIVLE